MLFSITLIFRNFRKLFASSPRRICFSKHTSTTNFVFTTSYFHSVCFINTIFTYETYHKLITTYSWSWHTIFFGRKITTDHPKIYFLTSFTNVLMELRFANGGGLGSFFFILPSRDVTIQPIVFCLLRLFGFSPCSGYPYITLYPIHSYVENKKCIWIKIYCI